MAEWTSPRWRSRRQALRPERWPLYIRKSVKLSGARKGLGYRGCIVHATRLQMYLMPRLVMLPLMLLVSCRWWRCCCVASRIYRVLDVGTLLRFRLAGSQRKCHLAVMECQGGRFTTYARTRQDPFFDIIPCRHPTNFNENPCKMLDAWAAEACGSLM